SAEVAAAYRQGHAGDVGGLVGGQEEDRADLFVDAPVAFHQAAGDGLVDDLLVPALFLLALLAAVARNAPGRCLGAAWGGGIDPDATAGRLEGQARGERVDPTLGRTVGHAVDPSGGDGRDVDD